MKPALQPSRPLLLALPLVCALLAGCPEPRTPNPAPLPGPVASDSAAPAPEPTPAAPAPLPSGSAHTVGLRQGALVPRISVEDVQGTSHEVARSLVEPSHAPVKECQPNAGGGIVKIRITGDHDSASLSVVPGSSANQKMRHCVLEALSTVDVPDTLSGSAPALSPTKGFSSIVTVQW